MSRYLLLCATRTRAPLPALAATIFLVLGVFSYRQNEVGATWGLTALLTCGLAAWIAGAVLAGEPAAQADMATAALGGRRSRLVPELLLAAAAAALLAAAFIGWPLALVALGASDELRPAARPGDVAAAVLAHLACGVLGGAIGVLFSPPRLIRRASAIAAVLAALLVLAAIGGVAGPVAVARALHDAEPGTVGPETLGACAGCLVLAAAALAAATRWAARRG